MSATVFTDEQKRAIFTRDAELLVAAAAGSGKTAVLVERIMSIITDKAKPVDIDRLLVVTFTEAAATEMRQRISAGLYKRHSENPQDEHLQKQLVLMNRAQITTIHKFCTNVIRRNFQLVDLDPGFKIADETEVKLLKSQLLDELFEQEYSGDNAAFFTLVEYYGGGRTKDDGLQELVLELYDFISSSPWPERWLQNAVEMFRTGDGLETSIWVEIIRGEVKRALDEVEAAIKYGMLLCAEPDGPDKYLEALHADKYIVDAVRAKLDCEIESLYDFMAEIKHEDLKRYSKKESVDPKLKDMVKVLRDKEIKQRMAKIREKLLVKPLLEFESDIESLYPILGSLTELTISFGQLYSKAKREKNIADFSDLEHYCLQVLLLPEAEENNLLLSPVALELREFYTEVLIDEYQDSNLVQEILLSAVSRENPPNRFMVGDIKQSIYKFRRAKPELFMDKYKRFSAEPSLHMKIDLAKNFRSRQCVLDAVNFFFYQLMTEEAGEIEYDDNAALYPGAEFPSAPGLNISESAELLLVENTLADDDDVDEPDDLHDKLRGKIYTEAMAVANRINELVNGENPLYVYDSESKAYRKAEYRDIVILVRSIRGGTAETFIETLKLSNIPAFANTATGYFDATEIKTILSYLKLIDNPLQDIELAAVLRSPIYGLTNDELLEIRNIRQKAKFFNCVAEFIGVRADSGAVTKLKKFMSDLGQFRRQAVYMPISLLIQSVLETTGYFNIAGVMSGGVMRQANLRLLLEKAAMYEDSSYKGLFHFIGYIDKLKKKAADEGDAKFLAENANLVRIMTIHKSKGLEFPIVFVSMLGRNFSTMDEKKSLILHQELGFGPMYIDLENRTRSNTLPRIALAKKIRQENIAEELRTLYVALTRAREKLILTGTVKELSKSREKWERRAEHHGEAMPAYSVLAAVNYLDWVMSCCYRSKESVHPINIEIITKDISDILDEKPITTEMDMLTNIENMPSVRMEERIADTLGWIHPFTEENSLPGKISISEMKRLHYIFPDDDTRLDEIIRDEMSERSFTQPRFLSGGKKVDAMRHGTIMHTVIEHMDFNVRNNATDLIMLIKELVAKNILERDEAEAVDFDMLRRFNESELMGRIVKSAIVKKEVPFVMGLKPSEIYRRKFADCSRDILVHGIIDCYFEEKNKLVLVDYKTNRYWQGIEDRYRLQLDIYSKALEKSTGMDVGERILFLLGDGKELRI